jgi:hypothetical protein
MTSTPQLTAAELAFLAEAAEYLETPSFLTRIAGLVGKPIEAAVASLPRRAQELVADATSASLRRGLQWALWTIPETQPAENAAAKGPIEFLRKHRHTALTAVTGAGGGFFGLGGMALEVPATTVLMLRSIGSIAAESGADLRDPATRLECLEVLSLGSKPTETMDSAYFSTRVGLTMAVRQAGAFVAGHSAQEVAEALAKGTAPPLIRLIDAIARRFQVVVTQKVAAQAVPLTGAALGALVNAAFTDHFNRVARFHFGILRLERRYGPDVVEAAYRSAGRLREAPKLIPPTGLEDARNAQTDERAAAD